MGGWGWGKESRGGRVREGEERGKRGGGGQRREKGGERGG